MIYLENGLKLKLFENIMHTEFDKIIKNTLTFNKNLIWSNKYKDLHLATSYDDLMEIFRLRSYVYTQMGYNKEFTDPIKGLNFDIYDQYSAIIYYKTDGMISGTTRVIFDIHGKLPVEKYYSCHYLRGKNQHIGELSRLIVKNDTQGLSSDFKNLMRGIYMVFQENEIDIAVSMIKEKHHKLYSKFGGITVERNIQHYGLIGEDCIIISYNPLHATKFFKRAILGSVDTNYLSAA